MSGEMIGCGMGRNERGWRWYLLISLSNGVCYIDVLQYIDLLWYIDTIIAMQDRLRDVWKRLLLLLQLYIIQDKWCIFWTGVYLMSSFVRMVQPARLLVLHAITTTMCACCVAPFRLLHWAIMSVCLCVCVSVCLCVCVSVTALVGTPGTWWAIRRYQQKALNITNKIN